MKLVRVAYNEGGTWGVLLSHEYPFAVTLELPWRYNQEDVSCIPEGKYRVRRIPVENSVVFKVLNVLNRTGIDIHVANTIRDLKGCIGVGEQFDYLGDERAILASGHAFNELITVTSGMDEFDLEIVGVRLGD